MPLVGPTSVLVLTKSIERQAHVARLIALGSGLGESFYAGLAFWGSASVLKPFLDTALPYAQAIGCVICGGLGYTLWHYKTSNTATDATAKAKKTDETSDSTSASNGRGPVLNLLWGMSLSLLNPGLIASWTGLTSAVAGTGFVDLSKASPLVYSIGVFVGIQAWYSFLIWLLKRYQSKLPDSTIRNIMKGTGVILIVVSITLFVGALKAFEVI